MCGVVLLEVENSSPLGIGFAHGEELGEERRGTFGPCVDNFLFLVEPLFRFSCKGKGKQTELYACKCNVFDDYGVIELEEVLEMCVCVVAWQTMELVCLHHHDEASAELKVSIPSVDSRPSGHVGNIRNRVFAESLGHSGSSGWCGVDKVICRWRRCGRRCGTGGSGSCTTPQDCLRVVDEVLRQIGPGHTLSLFSPTTGESKQS